MKFSLDGYSYEASFRVSGRSMSIERLMKQKRTGFDFSLRLGEKLIKKKGNRGDHCIWLPLDGKKGLKIIWPNEKYSLDFLYENVEMVQALGLDIFPEIYSFEKSEDHIVAKMERVNPRPNEPVKLVKRPGYMPEGDFFFAREHLCNRLEDLDKCVALFNEYRLCPEDEWWKDRNMIGGKIIDFHTFTKMPKRYKFPAKVAAKQAQEIYETAVKRYKKRGDNKWKGKIYQGMRFSNGYVMKGYSSDKKEYDSYRKLPFVPIRKSKGEVVVDLGSNEGFFSFQAAVHGAKQVYGIELTKEDVLLAKDIQKITELSNIKFVNDDILRFIDRMPSCNMVMMPSVLHQIYKDMEGSEEFLRKIAAKTQYFSYETPVNHPLMKIPLSKIHSNLKRVFSQVRLLYTYDAYSSGYRAVFLCYAF